MTRPTPSSPGIAPPPAAGPRARRAPAPPAPPADDRPLALRAAARVGQLVTLVLVLFLPCLALAGAATGLVMWLFLN
ncbi:hypothetical protein [Kitasatospora sp. NPDC101183]|uniref:hypothetical protein n=1 Tax=Kitasatospora sp. NPDC101183 TaxID=3364100 RepID=UPI0037F50B4A